MNLRSVVVVLILLVSSILILVEAASVKANRKAALAKNVPLGRSPTFRLGKVN
jgi:hypothetical protein